jgi:hypothetical protein
LHNAVVLPAGGGIDLSAPYMRSTILSDFQKLNRFIAKAMKKAMTMPPFPPTSAPMATKMPVSTASSRPVLAKLVGMDPPRVPPQKTRVKRT